MRLCDALKEKEMDVRLRDRHVAEGLLSSKAVDKYLKSLDDDANNCVEFTADSTPSEDTAAQDSLLDNEV